MSEEKSTISVSEITMHKLRSKHSWADIAIDIPRKGAVQVLINSDYGSWSYFWGACGEDWRSFLSRLDRHYMAGKFGCSDHFDDEGTLKMYKERIIESRKMDEITQDEARECWDEIERIIEGSNSIEAFQNQVYSNDCFNWMYDGGPDVGKTICPHFNTFFNTFWKDFCDYITEPVQENEVA